MQILLQRYDEIRKEQKIMRKLLNICLLVLFLTPPAIVGAQTDSVHPAPAILTRSLPAALNNSLPSHKDSINRPTDSLPDSLKTIPDSLHAIADTLDSIANSHPLPIIHPSPNALTSIVHYQATDSIAIDINKRKAQLYSQGVIEYDGMELKAESVHVDFDRQILNAQPVTDTNGKVIGRPFFKQGEDEYMADTITFNYNTRKGIISGVITQQGDGFLHGSRVKKVSDSVMYLNGGQYTTCNHAHPHFAINFTHSKLITGDKIFTGPAYVTIEDVPTPLVLPFAFFPMTHDRTSGILMPSYGWMNNRGYYLKDGGYYFALNDNIDLALIGEIYTNLSWAAEARSNYNKRYKYKGNFDIRYGITKEGIPGDSNTFRKFSDFKIAWKHDQDPKANPHSRFSANVNLQSRNYNKNTTNRNDYFNSTTTSSISYNGQIGTALNFAASFRESYNAQTGLINIKLPSLSLSSTTFYPLRRKEPSGSYRWYENISLSYSLAADNNITAQDSDLFKLSTLNRMQYGISHTIPLSLTVKVLRYFNWTNSANFRERWHWSTIRKTFDTVTNTVTIDTVRGFRANRDISFTSSLSTRIYGMFNFKFGPVKAIRHVINPSIAFNFQPDFGNPSLGWWQSYTDNTGYVHRYSIFEQSLYGGPADGRSGCINFSIGNNLEMKVANPKDTVTGTRKITLLENLNLNMSYDMARDSLQWSDLTISGRTTLFKNLVLNYSGSFSPYYIDNEGRKHNQFIWNTPGQKKILQKNNSTWSTQISYSINNNTFKPENNTNKKTSDIQPIVAPIMQSPYNYNPALLMGTYADCSMPWNLSLNYTLSYVSTYVAAQYNFKKDIIQTLGISANANITENWRIAVSTGYDFVKKGISYTSIDIYRDLHCWEMRFNWVPFGYYKSWNFVINIKASSLKDVKYQKQQSYQDNQGYYSY